MKGWSIMPADWLPCQSFYATENDEVASWVNKDKKDN